MSDPREEADDLADSVDRLLTVRYCLRVSESAGNICMCSQRVTILLDTPIMANPIVQFASGVYVPCVIIC